MAVSLIDKLTNFLMQEEEKATNVISFESKPQLRLCGESKLNIAVGVVQCFDEVLEYADALKNGKSVIINLTFIDVATKQKFFDYLNGVSYALQVNVEKVSDNIVLYVPQNVEVCKEMYAYAVPAYIKQLPI